MTPAFLSMNIVLEFLGEKYADQPATINFVWYWNRHKFKIILKQYKVRKLVFCPQFINIYRNAISII